ncbi:MAG: hypothetical protein K2I71_03135, partial [Helicobacter sp.]|nr:hypothetical protein [Helicobacter sp.]
IITIILETIFKLWNNYEKEQEFQKRKNAIKENLERQRKEILEFIDSENFIKKCFGDYMLLKEKYMKKNEDMKIIESKQQEFEQWANEAKMIEEQFKLIGQV